MDFKEKLTSNNITQQEFADYIGIDRVSLNKNLNQGKQKKGMINNLKMIIAEKRGVKLDIAI
jgi:DNA-binding Xre family transcriptional regulator